ncbi:MAG: VUT family protein [Sphingomonadales bacterium]|nr:MAG: VUT family protein [Sphingomonadales bacterium]
MHLAENRSVRLLVALAGFLITDAVLAEFVGVKIFSLEQTLGIDTVNWKLLGIEGSLNFTAGVLYWPIVFILTDLINEYYGRKGVRLVSWLAVAFIAWAFLCAYLAISIAPAPFWVAANAALGVPDIQAAFAQIFGQGMWTIAGSICAFLIGQLVDVTVFHRIRRMTGERWMWLRATGSTAVSQLFDSLIVLYIAFVIGPQHWPVSQWLAVGSVNYVYKMLAATLSIPLLYLVHGLVKRYLGRDEVERLRHEAAR